MKRENVVKNSECKPKPVEYVSSDRSVSRSFSKSSGSSRSPTRTPLRKVNRRRLDSPVTAKRTLRDRTMDQGSKRSPDRRISQSRSPRHDDHKRRSRTPDKHNEPSSRQTRQSVSSSPVEKSVSSEPPRFISERTQDEIIASRPKRSSSMTTCESDDDKSSSAIVIRDTMADKPGSSAKAVNLRPNPDLIHDDSSSQYRGNGKNKNKGSKSKGKGKGKGKGKKPKGKNNWFQQSPQVVYVLPNAKWTNKWNS